MKIAITGVTGFIGSRLAMRLQELGHEVVALGMVNNEVEQSRCSELAERGIEVLVGSVSDNQYLDAALAGCKLLFHLAAAQHEANVDEAHFRKINVDGTRNILDAAIQNGVKRFVLGSTIGVYGEGADNQLGEASSTRPDNHYGRTKLAGEAVALEYKNSLPVVVVRISEAYGPGDRRLLKLFRGIKRGVFFIAGNGKNLHQLIYIDDLNNGLIAAATTKGVEGEVFLLAGIEAISTTEMCAQVASAIGSRPPWLRLPLWPFMWLAWILETVCLPIRIQPPIHRRRLDFFRKTFLIDGSKAKQQLCFVPKVSFAEGAIRTGQWYTKQGLL